MRYPLLAVYAALPFAAFAADNRDLVSIPGLGRYYLGVLLPVALATAIVEWRRGAAAANRFSVCLSVALLITFDYRDLKVVLRPLTHDTRLSMVFLWAVILAGALFLTARIARRFSVLPAAMLGAGVIALAPPVASLAAHPAGSPPKEASMPAPSGLRLTRRPAPNIYFFLLDAYGRSDRLRQQFRFDNSRFLRGLRAAGFVVPAQSEAAYGNTPLSVPSILDMNYPVGTGRGNVEVGEPDATTHAGRNPLVRALRDLGYKFALAPPEVFGWHCMGYEDVCIHPTETYRSEFQVSDLAWTLMRRTPAADLVRAIQKTDLSPLAATRQFPLTVVKAAERLGRRPLFTYAHVLLTHWPYVYVGRRCGLRDPAGPTRAREYLGSVACANASTLAAVHYVLRRHPDAVIVLASDHGSDIGADRPEPQAEWPGREVGFRFSNFVAMRLPRDCRHSVPQRLAAVNIFRVVLRCLTDRQLPLLPARRYLRTAGGLEVQRPW